MSKNLFYHAASDTYIDGETSLPHPTTGELVQLPVNWTETASPAELVEWGVTSVSVVGENKDTRYYVNMESRSIGVVTIVNTMKPIFDLVPFFQDSVQQHLDNWARTRNYDGIMSLCTYATSTNSKFAAEGKAGVDARDATWAACYALLAEVEAGKAAMPTSTDALIAQLPILAWLA